MIAYLDCFSGVSGDKFLAALVDAGFDPERLTDTIAGLDVGEHEVVIERMTRHGIACLGVRVDAAEAQPERSWKAMREMLERSDLRDRVKEGALRTFELLAEAEAKVHGTSADDVHFHEVGALDSILDIVGVAEGLADLGIDEIVVSPVVTGFGTVETSHGVLPVPAPATAELLLGVPSLGGEVEGELTTPTGAALVRAFATAFGSMPPMKPSIVGSGGGSRELPIPNVLRLTLGERTGCASVESSVPKATANGAGTAVDRGESRERVVVLETNIDHLSAEQLAFAAERLMAEGALDVWHTSIVMKKGRPGVAFSAMASPSEGERLAGLMMEVTGSLGVRTTPTQRIVASRRVVTVETSLGQARVKVASIGGRERVRPEHEDVARIARETGRPIDDVSRAVTLEAETVLGC